MSDLDDTVLDCFDESADFAGETCTLNGADLFAVVSQVESSRDVARAGFLDGADASATVRRADLLLALDSADSRAAIGMTLTLADGTPMRIVSIAQPVPSLVDLSLSANFQVS